MTTDTVIKPNQNGSSNIRSDIGRYGMFNTRREQLRPKIINYMPGQIFDKFK